MGEPDLQLHGARILGLIYRMDSLDIWTFLRLFGHLDNNLG